MLIDNVNRRLKNGRAQTRHGYSQDIFILNFQKFNQKLREEKYHNHNFNTHTSTRRELGLNPRTVDELL